jgi:Protein of unknown function (DUF3631)
VPRPMQAVNMSSSALFRSMGNENGLPTILYDEIDTVFGPKTKDNNEDIRGLLNAGHRRGQKAYRSQVRGTTVAVEGIEAFGALAMAGLGWLPDTILTRSVIIRMRRRHPGENVEPFRFRLHEAEGFRIRTLIEQWATGAEINWPELPHEIQDRDADVWESLIGVADAIGGEWPARAREAAVSLVTESKEREFSLGIRLLADLRTVFGDRDAMFSKSILLALHGLEESPWSDLQGKPLNDRGLAHRLKQYGLKSGTVRIGNETAKGYGKADLVDVWQRYLPPSPYPGKSVTSVTSPVNQSVDVTDVSDVTDFSGNGGARVCGYCLNPETEADPLCEVIDGQGGAWLHRTCVNPWNDLALPTFLDRRGTVTDTGPAIETYTHPVNQRGERP